MPPLDAGVASDAVFGIDDGVVSDAVVGMEAGVASDAVFGTVAGAVCDAVVGIVAGVAADVFVVSEDCPDPDGFEHEPSSIKSPNRITYFILLSCHRRLRTAQLCGPVKTLAGVESESEISAVTRIKITNPADRANIPEGN